MLISYIFQELIQFALENSATNQAASAQKHDQRDKKRPDEGEISLEVVGLKRETSRVQLDVTTVPLNATGGPVKVKRNLKTYMANIKIPDVGLKTNDIASRRTNSLILADANQTSTRFIKTLLSPIQSESDCSKVGVAARSSDCPHIVEEATGISVENFRQTSLQSPEINKKPAGDDTSFRPPDSIKEWCSTTKIITPDESNLCNEELMARLSMSSEQSPMEMNLDENNMEVKFLTSNSFQRVEVPQQISNQMKTTEAQPVEEEFQVSNPSYQSILQLLTIANPTLDEKKAIKREVETVLIENPNSKSKDSKIRRKKRVYRKDVNIDVSGLKEDCFPGTQVNEVNSLSIESHYRDRCSGEPIVNKEFNRKNQQGTTFIEENRVSADEKKSHGETSNGSSTKNTEHRGLVARSSRKRGKSKVEELPTLPPKSTYHIPIPKKKREDDGAPKETRYSCSSLTITCPSKERSSLHAIFSSPDTEIFGSRKKSLAQPFFIRTAFCEDEVPLDSQKVAVELISKEPFELRAKVRPQSNDSLMLVDETWETLSTIPGTWYKEFRHPVMSSEEFKSDVMKSDRYR